MKQRFPSRRGRYTRRTDVKARHVLLALSMLACVATSIALHASESGKQVAPLAASASMDSSTPEPYRRRDFAIRLHRSAGRVGKEYTVTILGDRSVTFVASIDTRGDTRCCDFVRKKTLSVEDYDNLVKRVEGMDFFELESNYPSVHGHFIAVIDASAASTTVSGPYGTHEIDRSEIEPCETDFRKVKRQSPAGSAHESNQKRRNGPCARGTAGKSGSSPRQRVRPRVDDRSRQRGRHVVRRISWRGNQGDDPIAALTERVRTMVESR